MKSFLHSTLNQFRQLNRPARLFLLALFLDGLLFAGWNLFFNLYILDAGYSRDFLGLVNTAPSLSALLLGVPMGLLSDRMGRKRAMMVGFALANFAIITMILGRSQAVILAGALILGATSQLYVLSQAPFMMKTSDDKTRDILFSLSYGCSLWPAQPAISWPATCRDCSPAGSTWQPVPQLIKPPCFSAC
jgi:MFS family permease